MFSASPELINFTSHPANVRCFPVCDSPSILEPRDIVDFLSRSLEPLPIFGPSLVIIVSSGTL